MTRWRCSASPAPTTSSTTELIYLGYPGGRITDIAQTDTLPITNSQTGIQRTYAEDFDASVATCNGDFRYLLERHALASSPRPAMRADLDSLLAVTSPSDIYTHASFDGHPDHAEIGKQLMSAVRRANAPVRVHTTIQHPYGDGDCMELSSARWPNPALLNNNPFARFTPTLDFTAPPAFPCDPADTTRRAGARWAPPNEIVDGPGEHADDVGGHEQEVADDQQARVADRLHEPGRVPRQLRLHAGVRQAQRVLLALRLRQQAHLAEAVHHQLDVERLDRPAGPDPRGPVALRERRRAPAHHRASTARC